MYALRLAGIITMTIAILHVAIIIGGPKWYRFFGAGEGMAQLAENGSSYPSIITSVIALVLSIWACYAFSGAGIIQPLPFLKPVLIIVSTVFLFRGVFGIPATIFIDHTYLNELRERMTFMIVSSSISLILGILYLIGVFQIGEK